MLLDLVASVVFDLVVDIEQNVLPHPITFHVRIPSGLKFKIKFKTHRISASDARNFCVARNNVFFAVSSVVFSISPTVRNFSP